MTIDTLPSQPHFADGCEFGLVSNTQTDLTSPIKQTSQILELPGARFRATYALPTLSSKNETHKGYLADWRTFLFGRRGRAQRFYGYDPDFRTARGSAKNKTAGSLTVIGGSPGPTGTTIPIAGADPFEAGVFLKGDYIAYDVGLGRQLFIVMADTAAADSSGEFEVTVEPPIRTSPSGGEAIIFTDASCVMRLVDDEVFWRSDGRGRINISFSAIEIFEAGG